MSNSNLPERASLEYLKKRAKDRLQELRRSDPDAKLASALLSIARDHGFSSWRALKAELDGRRATNTARFFDASASGDIEALREHLANDPSLTKASDVRQPHRGWTGLHSAARHGHADAVRLLLEHGADPNAREAGDNTYALHWAAAHGHLDTVRALLDAGGEVHGFGDVHELDAIGWATYFHKDRDNREVVSLLVERGARHHIFSAISIGGLDRIQELVEQNPEALDRRMSRFEQGRTPLHFAISEKRYDILDLLIELGADVEAGDAQGRTPLAVAMLSGDREVVSRLLAAGAKPPERPDSSDFTPRMAALAGSIKKSISMIQVPDVAATLDWYVSIGFKETGRYGDDGVANFGMLSFGRAELMLVPNGKQGPHDVSLWFYTDRVDELYQVLKARQFDRGGIDFAEDINDPFYGGREFGIRDLNGYTLYFLQPAAAWNLPEKP